MSDTETGRALICMFCGEGFGYEGSTPDEATLITAVEHEKTCLRNPYKAEINRIKQETMMVHQITAICKALTGMKDTEILAIMPMEGNFSQWEKQCFCGGIRRYAKYLFEKQFTKSYTITDDE